MYAGLPCSGLRECFGIYPSLRPPAYCLKQISGGSGKNPGEDDDSIGQAAGGCGASKAHCPCASFISICLALIERLHRQLLDVIKDELDRRDEREINSVQALLLFNVGDQELTAGELRTRGHYLGSNVSYNLKKLVESWLHPPRTFGGRPPLGPRAAYPQGRSRARHAARAVRAASGIARGRGQCRRAGTGNLNVSLKRIERFWIDQVRFQL